MKICILRHGYYPLDPRVRKEAHALLEAGHEVDILCLKFGKQAYYEKSENLRVFRMPITHKRGNFFRYITEYAFSFILMSLISSLLFLKHRYDCIQVNTIPDFLVFATIIPKLLGAKVLLDLHEPSPELWITKFGSKYSRFLLPLQTKIEQMAIKYADASLTVTETLRRRFAERGADISKITVIPNVNEELKLNSSNGKPYRNKDHFTIVTHGTIEERYGHEVIIRAVNKLKKEIPNLRFNLLGFGAYRQSIIRLVNELGCNEQVHFFDYLPFDELIRKLSEADAGVIAMYQNPYSELIDTNKMYEYIALNIPVITSRLPAIEENFSDSCLMYFEPGNYHDLARCIAELHDNIEKRHKLVASAYQHYDKLRWSKSKHVYLQEIDALATEEPVMNLP